MCSNIRVNFFYLHRSSWTWKSLGKYVEKKQNDEMNPVTNLKIIHNFQNLILITAMIIFKSQRCCLWSYSAFATRLIKIIIPNEFMRKYNLNSAQ